MRKSLSLERRRKFVRLDALCARLNDFLLTFAALLTALAVLAQIMQDTGLPLDSLTQLSGAAALGP